MKKAFLLLLAGIIAFSFSCRKPTEAEYEHTFHSFISYYIPVDTLQMGYILKYALSDDFTSPIDSIGFSCSQVYTDGYGTGHILSPCELISSDYNWKFEFPGGYSFKINNYTFGDYTHRHTLLGRREHHHKLYSAQVNGIEFPVTIFFPLDRR